MLLAILLLHVSISGLFSSAEGQELEMYTRPQHMWISWPLPWQKRKNTILLPNTLNYRPQDRIDLRNFTASILSKRVTPMAVHNYPFGLDIIFDHQSSLDFRNEYQFNFEGTSPLNFDDNSKNGWILASLPLTGNSPAERAGKMSSAGVSIRLTTFTFRFRAIDFPHLVIKAMVTNDVEGANVLQGGSGKDDSAFQIWFTFRVLADGQDRTLVNSQDEIRILGYYWGDRIEGISLKEGEIYENYFSRKNYLIMRLPEAHQVLLKFGKANLGKPWVFQRNFLQDLQNAYPQLDPEKIEILGITLQQDSNDTQNDSEAYFQYLKILP